MPRFILTIFLLLIFTSVVSAVEHPNVILVVTDDQGYGDIAAHGNTIIKTPEIDKLHNESIRFTVIYTFCIHYFNVTTIYTKQFQSRQGQAGEYTDTTFLKQIVT
ncbi:MAG: sulfatase-like hydrolase/transferase [Planctomycetaceae bacterium]|jgi:hypothetical protein|nr:sulfatase-like hydrolase/transferase [Planctomycetaceae bacterium]